MGQNKRATRCSPQKRSYSNSCQWIETQPTQMHICCYIPYIPRSHIVSRRCATPSVQSWSYHTNATSRCQSPTFNAIYGHGQLPWKVHPKLIANHCALTPVAQEILFNLQQPQLNAISEIKCLITSPSCLKFYDPNLPTQLRPDVNQDGLGALLEQNHKTTDGDQWFPTAYASRELLP